MTAELFEFNLLQPDQLVATIVHALWQRIGSALAQSTFTFTQSAHISFGTLPQHGPQEKAADSPQQEEEKGTAGPCKRLQQRQ